MLPSAARVTFLGACLLSLPVLANSSGIEGRSGKQGAGCMTAGCHDASPGGVAPTVVLQGPTTLAAGETGNYTLVITGGPAVKAGMNVAVGEGGGTLGAGAGSRAAGGGELVHASPRDFTAGEARFAFTWVAPATARTVTMYASGNSANGNGTNTGDRAASTTLSVQVTAAGAPDGGSPGAGGGEDGGGGCTAAGGAPLLALLALAAVSLRRRR
jgi:Synergist-CTERM protein sorting domain-containing protein